MYRHTTLQQYLNRRRAQNPMSIAQHHREQPPGVNMGDQLLRKREVWETTFMNSKRQCLQELRRIKDNISSQELYISKWLQNFESNVFMMMDQEFQKIRLQILNSMDSGHQENKKRLKENFRNYGSRQLAQVDSIRSKLTNVRYKIQQYQQELESTLSYKKGIIDVVGSDFERQRDQILSTLSDVLSRYEGTVFLKVDANRFNRMRDDSHNLFYMDNQHMANPTNPFASTLVGGAPINSNTLNSNYISPTNYNKPGMCARLGNFCCGDTRDVSSGKAWGTNTQRSVVNSPGIR